MMEYVLLTVVVLFAAYTAIALQIERRRSIKREEELLAAILAKTVDQYVGAVEALRRTPKDKREELRIENELSIAAVKLQESEGIPVR